MEKSRLMKGAVARRVDATRGRLFALSRDIWERPEVSGRETAAHDALLRLFAEEDEAWTVEGHFGLDTAFRATWGPCGGGEGDGAAVLNVGFLCEYDALPGIGHACGHNLIAEAGAAAALGLKGALQEQADIPVRITVLGTPSEEDGGGKIDLIKAGAFDELDLAFMAHPAQQDAAFLPCTAIADVTVKYFGKASHAAAYPSEGVNALDAAVLAYNNVSVLRQQLKADWKLHGIIKSGGTKPNIIPAYTELEFYLRTPLVKELSVLKAKTEACFRAAAMATGCEVEISYPNPPYSNILPNATLIKLFEENGKELGVEFPEEPDGFCGSTDFGNVSFVVPGIHPFFYIGSDAKNHTEEYTAAAGSEKAQLYTLRTAKALAMTAVDVVCRPNLLTQVREDFARAKDKQDE